MRISIITLFPEIFEPVLNSSILLAAFRKGLVKFELINLRDFGEGPHKTVDARIYGGGAGMLLRADILAKAWNSIPKTKGKSLKTILTSASGKTYAQSKAKDFSKLDHLILVCGHYEGIDQRFTQKYVDEEISIGDYVLTGGELPAMIIADSVTRLVKGVLKKEDATANESFENNLLEHPHYTRPEEFDGLKVPEVLRSGNHKEIEKWRNEKSLEKTKKVRPDLLKS